jgi:hypothetical protein
MLALAALIGCAAVVMGRTNATAKNNPSADEAAQVATDAYIYGYSLITTELTRVQMSNVPKVEENMHAPMADFFRRVLICLLAQAEPARAVFHRQK